jgi:signal transduction histidine kinase/DNA-binding response OmpR family regulator/ligand-binding sensor domain-containing protein
MNPFRKIRCIFTLIALLPALECFSMTFPETVTSYLDMEGELNRQAAFAILKSDDGFVWIATRSQLTRYDGRNMTHYWLNESQVITDADGRQTFIRMAPDGSLWAFTDNGKVFRYNQHGDRFELWFDTSPAIGSLHLNDIYFHSDLMLWLSTDYGLYIIDNRTLSTSVDIPASLCGTLVHSIVRIDDHICAVNTNKGVAIVEVEGRKLTQKGFFFNGDNVLSGYYDPLEKILWSGTFDSGLKCLDLHTNREVTGIFQQSIPSSPIRAIRPFGWQNILVGLDGAGVYMLNKKTLEARKYISANELTGGGLRGNGVYDIMVDDNRIWVATYTGGVTIIDNPEHYQLISHIPYNSQSLPNNHVSAVLEDRDGDMWYATVTGISLYMQREGRWRHFIDDGKTYLTISQDHNGKIWCGGYNAGTYCIDKHRGIVRTITSLEGAKHTDCIYASLVDRQGDLWLGGLFNRLTRIVSPGTPAEKRQFYDITDVNSLAQVNESSILVNTCNGFYILDKQNDSFCHYMNASTDTVLKINSFNYTGIAIGDKIWLGTSGGGLNLYDLHNHTVKNFSTVDGLPSNFIFAILHGKDGNLWISTGNGIFCFDPVKERLLFNVNNLPTSDYVFMSACLLHDGRMAFGSVSGAVIIDPAKAKPIKQEPKLVFTKLHLFYDVVTAETNPEILSDHINNASQVRLKYNQNSFSLDFGAVDLYHPDNFTYSYFLQGFDEQWSPESNYNKADYTNIAPGHYRLSVKCTNRNSPDETVVKNIDIHISQPFWNSIVAWIIYLILLIGLSYWVLQFYSEWAENRRFDDKINFFINVTHDIRTPLSLVIAPLKDLEKESGLNEHSRYLLGTAIKNSNNLLSLVKRLLDFHKIEAAKSQCEFTTVNLNSYVSQKTDELRSAAEKKEITLTADIPQTELFSMTDYDRLNHIFDNLLSNAIKYTEQGGHVNVTLALSGKKILLEVKDDGIGIGKEEHKKIFNDFYRSHNALNSGEIGSGIGLAIARRLTKQIKGKLSFTSQEGKGSTFRLKIPYITPKGNAATILSESESKEEMQIKLYEKEHSTDKERILLVEDNDDMRNYLTYSLSTDYQIYAVSSAEEALAFFKKSIVDIVVSDVMMGGMSGIELCRKIKNSFETSHLFVILVTAVSHQDSVVSGFESGADDYITKPFDIDLLKMKISNMLQTRKKIQQHYISSYLLKENEPKQPSLTDSVNNLDDDFLKKSISIVTKNIDNPDFTINKLCRELAMSRTLVYEKLRAMTGQPPSEFIRTIKLRQAKQLLLSGKYAIPDVAVMTGFSDAKYFSTVFKKYFGKNPSTFIPID